MSTRARPSNLVVASGRGNERRAEFERQFGAPVERVRGLDRYVKTRRDDVDEVLVDPVTVLPVEFNTVRAGALGLERADDLRAEGQRIVRPPMRSARNARLPDTARRVVTTIDVTNVQVVAGGGQ